MFVSNLMGGTQIDEIAAPNEIVKLTDQVISYVKEVLQSNVVRAIITNPCRNVAVALRFVRQGGGLFSHNANWAGAARVHHPRRVPTPGHHVQVSVRLLRHTLPTCARRV